MSSGKAEMNEAGANETPGLGRRSGNILYSDPLVERLIRAAHRKNVATEMITVLGKCCPLMLLRNITLIII